MQTAANISYTTFRVTSNVDKKVAAYLGSTNHLQRGLGILYIT
jgi:hypothetical protein